MYIGAVLDDGKHITVAFNGHDETAKQYKNAVAALALTAGKWYLGPICGAFGDLERFEPANVWVTRIESDHLHVFRNTLIPFMDLRGVNWSNEFGYKPHVTMTKWKEPKSPIKGHIEITHMSVFSNEHGETRILL